MTRRGSRCTAGIVYAVCALLLGACDGRSENHSAVGLWMQADGSVNGGNGTGYTGDINRGPVPEKLRIDLGLIEIGTKKALPLAATGVTSDAQGNVYLTGVATLVPYVAPFDVSYLAKFAANGDLLWATTISNTMALAPHGVAVSPNGDLLVAGDGVSGSVPGASELGSGALGCFLASYDPATGANRWIRVLHTPTLLQVAAFKVDAAGNSYIAGFVPWAPDLSFPNLNFYGPASNAGYTANTLIVKFDPSGAYQWTTELGNGHAMRAHSLAVLPSGEVAVSGSADASVSYPGIPFNPGFAQPTDARLFLADLGTNGTLKFTSELGASDASVQGGLVTADPASGDLFFAGSTRGHAGSKVLGTHGTSDLVVARLDSSGAFKWIEQLGSASSSITPADLTVDATGELFIGGITDTLVPGAAFYGQLGGYNAFVSGLDLDGALLWITEFGTGKGTGTWTGANSQTSVNDLFPAAPNGVYVAGYTVIPTSVAGEPIAEFVLFELDNQGYMLP